MKKHNIYFNGFKDYGHGPIAIFKTNKGEEVYLNYDNLLTRINNLKSQNLDASLELEVIGLMQNYKP